MTTIGRIRPLVFGRIVEIEFCKDIGAGAYAIATNFTDITDFSALPAVGRIVGRID